MDQNQTVLTGPSVTLRPGRAGYGEARRALGVHPEIYAGFGADPARVTDWTPEQAAAWEDKLLAEPHAWAITVDGGFIGVVKLHSMNPDDRRAMVDIGILDPAALGQGYGTEALRLVAAQAFGPMGLHRLALRVLSDNHRAQACYRKVGFVEEGRERESARVGDTWVDDIMMGLLAHEFEGAP